MASCQLAALFAAVDTSKRSGQHERHQQAPRSQNEHIGDVADVELAYMGHKKIPDHGVQRFVMGKEAGIGIS
jgi:hypothetical protein